MIRAIIFLSVVCAALCGKPLKPNQAIFAGSGPSPNPIGITPPNFPGGTIANDAPPGPFFQDFRPPFPTDAWWSGYTVSNQNADVAGPFPYQSATLNEGVTFGMGDVREFDGTSIKVHTQKDWTAGIAGLPDNLNGRKATGWDTQVVCMQYFNGAGATMDSCMVPGSPYMTFTFNNAAVVLTSNKGEILNFEWVNQGRKARVVTAGGTYLIYSISGTIELTAGQTTITSPAGWSGTLRFAKVKDPGQETLLDAHSETYATGLHFSYNINGDTSTQTWTWEVVGNAANLLILSWPHHRKTLVAPNYVNIEYLTLKGVMRGIAGNNWLLRNELPTISFMAENAPHPSCVPELIKTLEVEVNKLEVMIPGDFYFWGGAFGRASRLALIAEHVGRNDLIDKVVSILKTSVEYWFDGNRLPVAAYETGWGGFINKEGWNNTWVDFGNAYYNDHHFHYGYLLQGGATIGKYDPGWLNQHIDFFTHVARNVGNPSPNDPHYTVTRHMDFFAGHSWASGIANGAGARDQESSTEAVNGYYGLLLFAHATNNRALIDWSRMILAMEILGSQTYWHLYPNAAGDLNPYPEQAFRELITVGNVMDAQAGAWLFWGAQRIQIAAIQILPLTPIGQVTYDREWMEHVLPYCRAELDDVTLGDDFKSVIYAAYAKVNPQEAYMYSSNLFDWGSGNSASNQLYFVATQPSNTDICAAGAQTPEGTFYIQDVDTGRYVVTSGDGHLAANTLADALAAKFELRFTPGGGTIQAVASGKYVTASPDGTQALSAIRDVAQSYETFRWARVGDVYELTAMVNRQKVSTNAGSGELFNTGTASRYRLVPTDNNPPAPIAARGVLRNVQNGRFVVATAADPVLRTVGNNAGEGTPWLFEKVADSPATSPSYDLKSTVTDRFVTANMDGTAPLSATAPQPQAWEYFQIVPYNNAYIIVHIVSGKAVAAQGDNTLIDNNNSLDNSALWEIV